MANEVALRRAGGVVAAQKYADALVGLATLVGADMDGKPILKLDRQEGFWRFGENDIVLEVGDILAVNPLSFKKGYIAFADDGPAYTLDGDVAEMLVPVVAPMPYKDDLPEVEVIKGKRGKPDKIPSWDLQLTVDLVVVEGPNVGVEMVYKPTSKGGLRMVRKLSEEVARRLADGNEDCVPIIELFNDSYPHKTYGKVYTPEFAILEWSDMERENFGSSYDDDAEPTTKGRTTKASPHPKPGERTAKGHPVDTRTKRTARPVEPEYEEEEEPEEEQPRRRGRGVEAPTDKVVRGRDRGRSRDAVDAEEVEEAPPARRRTARTEEPEPAPRARTRRDRDTEEVEEEVAPSRRGRAARNEPEEEPVREPVRGRRAAAGGRRAPEPEEQPRTRRSRQ